MDVARSMIRAGARFIDLLAVAPRLLSQLSYDSEMHNNGCNEAK